MDAFEYLKDQLRERQWSIPQLARAAKVSIGLAYKWVAEDPAYRVNPSSASCRKLAAALGIDEDRMLEIAGHRTPRLGEPAARERVSARQRAIREDLDRWLAAVGPEHEEAFWSHLKAQGESVVALIRRMDQQGKTAINSGGGTADNGVDKPVVGRPGENGHGQDESGSGPITRAKQRRELVGAGAPTMGAALPQAA